MSDFRPRRAHRKSRAGCQQCKTRRVKCDETRPLCNNCVLTNRQCTYAAGVPLPAIPPAPMSTPLVQHGQSFNLEHMSLLLDANNHPDLLFMCDDLSWPIMTEVLRFALQKQHIMDQLIATSALRRAMTTTPCSTHYISVNEELEGRALSTHNMSETMLSPEEVLPRFIFSMMLGYSHLCEMLSSTSQSASVFFDKLRGYMQLVQLGKSMSKEYWASIMASEIRHIYFASGLDPSHPEAIDSEVEQQFTLLDEMLDSSRMQSDKLDLCRQALRALKKSHTLHLMNAQQTQRRTQAISVFLIYTAVEFVGLLEEGQPEALVTLAHYGAFLHKCREFWVVGDSGRQLVQLGSSQLGQEWSHILPAEEDRPRQGPQVEQHDSE